jgi:hypothetical protein
MGKEGRIEGRRAWSKCKQAFKTEVTRAKGTT